MNYFNQKCSKNSKFNTAHILSVGCGCRFWTRLGTVIVLNIFFEILPANQCLSLYFMHSVPGNMSMHRNVRLINSFGFELVQLSKVKQILEFFLLLLFSIIVWYKVCELSSCLSVHSKFTCMCVFLNYGCYNNTLFKSSKGVLTLTALWIRLYLELMREVVCCGHIMTVTKPI